MLFYAKWFKVSCVLEVYLKPVAVAIATFSWVCSETAMRKSRKADVYRIDKITYVYNLSIYSDVCDTLLQTGARMSGSKTTFL